MRLIRFRVIGFRSIKDSNWIDVDDVTALVGENESGKTNVLLPLWKLNPSSDEGAIDLIDDYPRSQYHDAYAMDSKDLPIFIRADFKLSESLSGEIAQKTKAPVEDVSVARVQRSFNGDRHVSFPNAKGAERVEGAALSAALQEHCAGIAAADIPKPIYDETRGRAVGVIADAASRVAKIDSLTESDLQTLREELVFPPMERLAKGSDLSLRYQKLISMVDATIENATKAHPTQNADAQKLVMQNLPSFVYYSSYGNLDSEIYLPHVIRNMERLADKEKLGARETAKARTLKVLFDFVKLEPEAILELDSVSGVKD